MHILDSNLVQLVDEELIPGLGYPDFSHLSTGSHDSAARLVDVIRSRVDGVNSGARLALKVASVLGQEFCVKQLEAIYPDASHRPMMSCAFFYVNAPNSCK